MTFTTEEFALMAKEAGLMYIPQQNSPLVRIVQKAVQLEREACAQIALAVQPKYADSYEEGAHWAVRQVAARIRARGMT